MDPPTMMSENAFQSGNTASYNLSEIWPFSINGGGETTGGGGDGLELRRHHDFGSTFSQFSDANLNDALGGVELRCGHGGGGRKRREAVCADDEAAKGVSTSCRGIGNGMNDTDGKRVKASGATARDQNHNKGNGSVKGAEQNNNKPDPTKDYIHVRARRGQATDSHSLAERARREKISERMRILQDLVPGCNKVIGKALVLDEIINYIQSLQRQVEFLSMKLEAVNSRITIGIEGYPSKDVSTYQFGQQAFDTSGVAYGSQAPQDYSRGSSPDWLHMQIGGGGCGFDKQT
ncbi:hypothetical protein Dimus_015003 [Dionaea muscipula]